MVYGDLSVVSGLFKGARTDLVRFNLITAVFAFKIRRQSLFCCSGELCISSRALWKLFRWVSIGLRSCWASCAFVRAQGWFANRYLYLCVLSAGSVSSDPGELSCDVRGDKFLNRCTTGARGDLGVAVSGARGDLAVSGERRAVTFYHPRQLQLSESKIYISRSWNVTKNVLRAHVIVILTEAQRNQSESLLQ